MKAALLFPFLKKFLEEIFVQFVAWNIDRTMKSSAHASRGRNSSKLSESDDDPRAEDEYISPSGGQKMSSNDSTLCERVKSGMTTNWINAHDRKGLRVLLLWQHSY